MRGWKTVLVLASVGLMWAQAPKLDGLRSFTSDVYRADGQNWAIVEDNRGVLYIGNTSGVLEFDGVRWRKIDLPGGRGAYSLTKAEDGRIWVGGEGEAGQLEPDPTGTMRYISKSGDLPADFRDSQERIFQVIDTPGGLVLVSDHWIVRRETNGAVRSVRARDHCQRAVWFGNNLYVVESGSGLMRLDGNALRPVAGGSQIRALAMVPVADSVLIPTYTEGLLRFNPAAANPFARVPLSDWTAADDYEITAAVPLGGDLLAFGTTRHGVVIVSTSRGVLRRIGTGEGLLDAHVYSVFYDHRGGLWAALDNGIALIGLSLQPDAAAVPFHALIRGVTGTRDDKILFGGTYSDRRGGVASLKQPDFLRPEFPFKYNAFRFAFSANGIQSTGDMQFRTLMNGVDTKWSNWSARFEREFTELRPGRWTFRVQARKRNGAMSAEAAYQLIILKAWYDTLWFTLVQVSVVLALLVLPRYARAIKGLQGGLINFSVIVPFSYISAAMSSTIGHYSAGVVFFKVLMSSTLSFILDPAKKTLKKQVETRSKRQTASEAAVKAKM